MQKCDLACYKSASGASFIPLQSILPGYMWAVWQVSSPWDPFVRDSSPHRVEVKHGRLQLGKLNGCDAHGPDVTLHKGWEKKSRQQVTSTFHDLNSFCSNGPDSSRDGVALNLAIARVKR